MAYTTNSNNNAICVTFDASLFFLIQSVGYCFSTCVVFILLTRVIGNKLGFC